MTDHYTNSNEYLDYAVSATYTDEANEDEKTPEYEYKYTPKPSSFTPAYASAASPNSAGSLS